MSPRAPQVVGQRRLPVGRHGHAAELAPRLRPGHHRCPGVDDHVPAAVPLRLRRHGEQGVLAQQRAQLGHVGPLAGVHEPLQHRPLPLGGLGVRRPLRPLGRQVLAQGGPGPLQRAVRRGHAHLEQLGGLAGRPAQHVAQDQHRPLPWRQVLHGDQERQLDRLPGHHHGCPARRRSGRAAGPGRAAARTPRPGCRRPAARRLPGMALQVVQAGVGGDPVEPGPERRAPGVGLAAPPGPQEGLLHHVLGVGEGAEHPVAVHLQLASMSLHQRAERGLVTALRRGDHRVEVGTGGAYVRAAHG